ncbi:hypothetical protein GMA8713_01333 [Grimontia marina]|uniref:Uncharacterized protein n=1 Tax=Grimontia marina TaxID=646534 RepID=A0A128F0M4_9GAMM|nr:hypothetical protein GMA8713_01333 [Grimontia marina]
MKNVNFWPFLALLSMNLEFKGEAERILSCQTPARPEIIFGLITNIL